MDEDPNFPLGLAIKPSSIATHAGGTGGEEVERWDRDTEADIEQYGIAGRIWEAVGLLSNYLVPPASSSSQGLEFDPPCDLFDGKSDVNIVELGSGTGVVGINVALHARRHCDGAAHKKTRVFLTDLDNVCPLLDRNARRAGFYAQNDSGDGDRSETEVFVQPLPWGSHKHAHQLLCTTVLTHIICSDLVYFPHLLAPLLRSLIDLTGVSGTERGEGGSPKVIIGYRVRSLVKEEAFWRAFAAWFTFEPVLCRRTMPANADNEQDWRSFGTRASDRATDAKAASLAKEDEEGEDAPSFVFVAARKSETLDWQAPSEDALLMGGWMDRKGADAPERKLGQGMDAFELLLFNALQG